MMNEVIAEEVKQGNLYVDKETYPVYVNDVVGTETHIEVTHPEVFVATLVDGEPTPYPRRP
jgi:hypothetical protein